MITVRLSACASATTWSIPRNCQGGKHGVSGNVQRGTRGEDGTNCVVRLALVANVVELSQRFVFGLIVCDLDPGHIPAGTKLRCQQPVLATSRLGAHDIPVSVLVKVARHGVPQLHVPHLDAIDATAGSVD